jgi:LPS-assembly lipoprotein
MSSPDPRSASRRPYGRLLAATAAVLLLAGCGAEIRPLYGSARGGATVEAIRHVDIGPGSDRIGQQIRNELVFAFYGGAGDISAPATHRLDITVTSSSNATGIVRNQNLPSAYVEQVTATYVLTEISGGHTVASGSSFANAAYDYSQQRFADARARRDAENRAAGVIATDIRDKVAVYFATRK